MQIGEALNGIGEGLLVDLGVFRPDPVADDAVVDGGEFEIYWNSNAANFRSGFTLSDQQKLFIEAQLLCQQKLLVI